MIFVLGTTAEAIKLAPILLELKRLGVDFRIVNTAQQGRQMEDTLQNFGIDSNLFRLDSRVQPISSVGSAFIWFIRNSLRIIFPTKKFAALFESPNDLVIVHGDTLSTLLGALVSIRFRGVLSHVEAGLRSYKMFHPFPEEIVRRLVSIISRIDFAPSKEAIDNLKGQKALKVLTHGNTSIDAMKLIQTKKSVNLDQEFCLVLLHRTELIRNNRVRSQTLNEIGELSQNIPVIVIQDFVSEDFVRESLSSMPRVTVIEKQDYFAFQELLRGARFVITDSGGLQEECWELGLPCLVHRIATERSDGLGENARLSRWKSGEIPGFYDIFENYKRPRKKQGTSPTEIIIKTLTDLHYI